MGTVDKGYATAALVVGIITGVCGFASAIAGFVWISYAGFMAYGVWSGFGLIIIGILGVIIYVKKSTGANVAFLILNILYIIVCIVQVALAGITAAIFKLGILALEASNCRKSIFGKCHCIGMKYDVDNCEDVHVMHDSLVAITAFCAIGAVSTFAGSIIGCCIACCNKSATVQPVIVQQPQAFVVTTTSTQPYPGQPQYPPPGGQAYPPLEQPAPYLMKGDGPPSAPPAY